MTEHVFHRSYGILVRKFQKYLLPTLVTTTALSLNEFADSMLVSNLLGSQAMAIVNLGFPLMLLMAAIETLCGSGGATCYALLLGEREGEAAGKVLFLSLAAALLAGLALMVPGMLFPDRMASLLCRDPALVEAGFGAYLRVLVLSAPVLAVVLTMVSFLPAGGSPNLAMAINLVANGVNIAMDWVYIRWFGMGVDGAAWATLTGYAAGALLLPFAFGKKNRLRVRPAGLADLRLLGRAVGKGAAAALSQLGFAAKFGACNVLASMYGGVPAVVALSLCFQAFSIVAVFYGGAIGAAAPILAFLHGRRDYPGRTHILKTALLYGVAPVLLCTAWFEAAPGQLAALYNITAPDELELALAALRVFSLCFAVRGFCIMFMYYLQVIGRDREAMHISLLDGFGIVPMAWLMCRAFGVAGLWWTYPLNAAVLFAGVLLGTRWLAAKSAGRYTGLLLAERDDDALESCDFTMTGRPDADARTAGEIADWLRGKGMDPKRAGLIHLAIEEIAVYHAAHQGRGEPVDVLLRTYEGRTEIDYRSLGDSCNPLHDAEADDLLNVRILRGIASGLDYDYAMGMNNIHITLGTEPKAAP